MATTLYDNVIKLLVEASVSADSAKTQLDRALTTKGAGPETVTAELLGDLKMNLTGIVVLRGDKSKLPAFRAGFEKLT